MTTDPQIVGWARTRFGKSGAPDTLALTAEVARPALDHASLPPDQVDGIFVGVWNTGFSRQDFQGALVAMGTPELAGVPFLRAHLPIEAVGTDGRIHRGTLAPGLNPVGVTAEILIAAQEPT